MYDCFCDHQPKSPGGLHLLLTWRLAGIASSTFHVFVGAYEARTMTVVAFHLEVNSF